MDIDNAATILAELGNAHRLATFRLLVRSGPEGLPVKAIQDHLGIPKSTLSHHISHMVWAGIVTQTREGRSLRCRIDYERVRGLLEFLMEDCCAGLELHGAGQEELTG
jgi:DNA-binding transcriptional ArsR family regulator